MGRVFEDEEREGEGERGEGERGERERERLTPRILAISQEAMIMYKTSSVQIFVITIFHR